MIIAFAMMLAVHPPPFGDTLPPAFLGSYALFDNDALSCSQVDRVGVTLTATTLFLRGQKLPILMVEKVSNQDWHIWVKAGAEAKDRKVDEFHLNWGHGENSDLVVASDEGIAESILETGSPVPGRWRLGSL